MRIGVIGGGASGLVASIFAKDYNNEVIIFERNKDCGKKILATGNGRCNYWNTDQNVSHYQSSEPNLIGEIVNPETDKKVLDFFEKLGIIPKIKNGYYYPFSNQASTLKKALLNEASRKNVIIKNEFLVTSIKTINNKFEIMSDKEKILLDKLIISTGSCASPCTGSDGMGYNFLEKVGHIIVKPLPALVQLKTNGAYLKKWQGIRTDVSLTLLEEGKKVKEESGEIQLTNYGISGICVFNLSNIVSRGLDNDKKEEILINFLPFIDTDVKEWFINQTKTTGKTIYDLLLSILNEKIVEVIFDESKVEKNKLFTDLSDFDKDNLLKFCTSFSVAITGTNSFNDAQVCSGGVLLSEFDLSTMESKKVSNLYVTGELLDITGDCGGYNLGIAWRTGLIAGVASRGIYD